MKYLWLGYHLFFFFWLLLNVFKLLVVRFWGQILGNQSETLSKKKKNAFQIVKCPGFLYQWVFNLRRCPSDDMERPKPLKGEIMIYFPWEKKGHTSPCRATWGGTRLSQRGVMGEPRPETLLGVPHSGRVNSLGLASLNNSSRLWALGWSLIVW